MRSFFSTIKQWFLLPWTLLAIAKDTNDIRNNLAEVTDGDGVYFARKSFRTFLRDDR